MSEQKRYESKIEEVLNIGDTDLSKKDLIRIKMHPEPTMIQDLPAGTVISPKCIVRVKVHNELIRDENASPDYTEIRILDAGGEIYLTSSENLYNALVDISEELKCEDTDYIDDFDFELRKIKSANQAGDFYTAVIK